MVGRHGFGEIQFERPVDLSGLSSLDELLGRVVQFRRTICHVYPEGYQEPPPGEGLNVPAIVRMVRCWPPIKNDEETVEDYVELLRMRPDTEFRSYDLKTGTWEFHVNHFSSYAVSGNDYYVSSSRRSTTSSTPSTSTPSSSTSPSLSRSGPSPPSDTYSHVLRSQTSYTNPSQYARSQGNPRLVSLVNQAYAYWRDQKPIPEEIRRKIEAVELTNDEYLVVFCNRETPEARAIELIDGRIRFREYTLPSHGAVAGNVSRQLVRQDPQDIFQCSSGVGRVLFVYFTDNEDIPLGNSNKQPDAMFSIVLANLPNGGAGHTFQQLPNGAMLFPVICFEISICNETLPRLLGDLGRYFQAGTGTRYWMGIKVFKNDPPGVIRWWAGHALRDQDPQTNMFLDSYTFQAGSMRTDLHRNADINVPVPGLQFTVDLATLLHPLAVPPGYAPQIVWDVEQLRQIIIQNL
jgi:hypothetical protein